ncbi:hypothetical protein CRYUN_Cryun37aG0085300 [Craigia yunnanensis]
MLWFENTKANESFSVSIVYVDVYCNRLFQIGKACGEKWKTMTYEEKVKYYDIATEKQAEFRKVMVEYVKRKESGEDQETEDDSEFDD